MAEPPFAESEPEAEDELEPLRRERKIKAAKAFLEVELMAGPRPARELTDKARTLGHAPSTLAIARKRLHLHSVRGEDNHFMWYTPTQWRTAKKASF